MIDLSNFIFFWMIGEYNEQFSNWYTAEFEIDGIRYQTVEQYFMAQKAKVFGDMAVYEEILQTSDPGKCKKLGRAVANFDAERWDSVKFEIMCAGSYAKYKQNQALKSKLLKTGERTLVEASPYDKIWGIGLGAQDAMYKNPNFWPGQNLLGKCLMQVREQLRDEELQEAAAEQAATAAAESVSQSSVGQPAPGTVMQTSQGTVTQVSRSTVGQATQGTETPSASDAGARETETAGMDPIRVKPVIPKVKGNVKISFLDVDGVLSAPCYKVRGTLRSGLGTVEEWMDFCTTHGEDAYELCKPVPVVKKYAELLKESGATLFALTTSFSSPETDAKRKFLEKYYPGLFENVIAVSDNAYKIPTMVTLAKKYGVPTENCEIVEDTLSLVFEAESKGFRGKHVSQIFADVETAE